MSSSALREPVIYIRGLNTYNDDQLHMGPIKFGLMHAPILKPLDRLGRQVIAVHRFNGEDRDSQVKAAAEELAEALASQPNQRFHLLGHSAGGVIARALAHESQWKDRILSVTTIASPHRGTSAAQLASQFKKRRPMIYRSCQTVGYDFESRAKRFAGFSPEGMAEFNERIFNIDGIKYASIVCALPANQMSWPMRLTSSQIGSKTMSDGIVDEPAQPWGNVISTHPLDHLHQIGFSFYLRKKHRLQARQEFLKMIQVLNDHWAEVEKDR